MKYYVTVAIPFETTSGDGAMKLADKVLRSCGLTLFEIEGVESEDARQADEVMAEDVPT